MRRLAVLALVLAPSIPRPSGACSPPPDNDGPHAIDVAFANDTVAPSVVTASSSLDLSVDGAGNGCSAGSCGDGGDHVYVTVSATDDQSPPERIGYTFAIAGGELPPGMTLPTGPVLSTYGDVRFRIYTNAGAFAFDLEIRAIDLNGNLGPPTVIAIANPA